jgi:small subunit ribosomal protein S6
LAYEINKNTEGTYVVVNLTSTSATVLELDRQLKLSEAVMRTKLLRADEAVVNIKPVVVPEVTEAEKAADAEEKPAAKAPAKAAATKTAAAKKPAATKASE